jgi:hypothetical protein
VWFRQGLDFAGSFDVDGGELTVEFWCPWRDHGMWDGAQRIR